MNWLLKLGLVLRRASEGIDLGFVEVVTRGRCERNTRDNRVTVRQCDCPLRIHTHTIAPQPDLTLSSALSGTPVIAAMLSGLVPRDLVLRCYVYLWYYSILYMTPVYEDA